MHNKKEIENPETDFLEEVVDTIVEQKEAIREEARREKEQVPKKTPKEIRQERKALKKLRRKSKKLKIPRTVQDTIPYNWVYPDTGIIETTDGVFSKSFLLHDINYDSARDNEQDGMFKKFGSLLNSLPSNSLMQIMVHHQQRNMTEFQSVAMMPMEGDELDSLRKEQNDLRLKEIRRGSNELVQYKYMTIATGAPSYKAILPTFSRMEAEVIKNVSQIGGAVAEPLSSAKRLEVLHDIYNPNSVGLFGNNMERDPRTRRMAYRKDKFSFDILAQMGLTTKDVIGPDSFFFDDKYGKVGDYFFRVLYISHFPAQSDDQLLKQLSDVECKMVTTITFQPIRMDITQKMISTALSNANRNMIERQKTAAKSGYNPDLVTPEARDLSDEWTAVREAINHNGQKLFFVTAVIVHFAETMEQLDQDTSAIQAVGRTRLTEIKTLTGQQPAGLSACLPLGLNSLDIKRTMITDCASIFIPFSNQELYDPVGGISYGINAISHNLILINRRNSTNGNAVIIGSSGTGKSVSAKIEMLLVYLSSHDHIRIIDPDGEYARLAELLGGVIIHVSPGSSSHINPFDIDMEHYDDEPITEKSSYICSLCETMLDSPVGINASQKSIIDRCVKAIYQPYIASKDPDTGKYDETKLPTLKLFYEELRKQNGYDAMQLAEAVEFYAVGTQSMFAYHTNIEYNARFVVYDIKDVGDAMKHLAELVVISNIWNDITQGRKEGRNVWFYIDEAHLLFQNRTSAEFLRDLYKRARKYGGLPTAITQNATDLVHNPIASAMIKNSEFVQILSQSQEDRECLGQLLNIPPNQLDFITNAPPGHGLIYDGSHIVPFINEIPKDTLLYKAVTTKLSEVTELKKEAQQEE